MRGSLRPLALLAFAFSLAGQSPGFWEERPRLARARQEVGAAMLGGEVHVAGGLLANRAATDTVERYHPATRTWSSAPSLPTTLHHFGMAAAGGKLYVVGGYVSGFAPDARCYCFDPGTQQWSRVADLPLARGALAAVEIGGSIYAVGGVAQVWLNTGTCPNLPGPLSSSDALDVTVRSGGG